MIVISKKNEKAEISIIGNNCEGVTGSCTKIEQHGKTYLFECGLIMDGKTVLENYSLNKVMLQKIKPKRVDIIILSHNHQDHIGMVPALYATGKCNARIIVPKNSTPIIKEMWLDCAWINVRDAEYLSQKAGKYIPPLFDESDVHMALKYIEEYESHQIFEITEDVSIRYTPAGHIFLSQQTEVILRGVHPRTILFTSDLGNIITQKQHVFVEEFEPVKKANIVIGECTYSAKGRDMTKKTYDLDMQKIKSVIEQYCIDRNQRVLIPTFSLDRMPYMLWNIFTIFGNDKNFDIPIVIDSPLAIRLLEHYSNLLSGDAKEKFDTMMNWKNIIFITDPEESKAAVMDKSAKCILSSSGMLTAGRSVKWTESILPVENDCILFCGYSTEGSLAYKIKNGDTQKTITINGKPFKNRAQICNLTSFSSHMQREDLINYYADINAERVYLVHSDHNKLQFKDDLEAELGNRCKTTKVICTNKSTKILL